MEIQRKKQKQSSPHNDEFEEEEQRDIISTLPNEILTHILAFLSETDAHRLRVLSNRWRDLCSLLPNLRFVMPWSTQEVEKFNHFVDHTLNLRDGIPIKRFSLCCSGNCDYYRVYNWVCDVIKCKVEELELSFPADKFRVRFCWDLFRTCKTLVGLTLRGEFVLDVPKGVLFPCLKKINLMSIVYSGDKSLVNLISGCPVLEELFVEREKLISQSDNLKTFKVSSPSLKKLKISFGLSVLGNHKVVIDAPKLEYIDIWDVMLTKYSLRRPLSLVEAHIGTQPYNFNDSVAQLVTGLSSVERLTLSNSTLMALNYVHDLNMPIFPNLVSLALGIERIKARNFLPLLSTMPNLEYLTLSHGGYPFLLSEFLSRMNWDQLIRMNWNRLPDVPACLRFMMKEITILNREVLTRDEFILIRYLLSFSNVLEVMRINGHNVAPSIREQLSKFDRGSSLCQLEFV